MANYNKEGKTYDYDGLERTVLRFSAKFIGDNGESPTLQQIADGTNIDCSLNTINRALSRLEDKGYIKMSGLRPNRTFEITNEGLEFIGVKEVFGMPMEYHIVEEKVPSSLKATDNKVLLFAADFIKDYHRSPSLGEISNGVDLRFKSIPTIGRVLKRLEEHELIVITGSKIHFQFAITESGYHYINDIKDIEEVKGMEIVNTEPVVEDVVLPVKEEVAEEISYKNFMKFRKAYCSNEAQAMLELLIENDLLDAKAFNKFVKEM